ncbi:VanW family protein [Paenibacillus sp. Marseille-Q4541]|uniref:VanW family protein n=1 Tax=Paenibacillus sp. Marseille-Q4541 TaxID=2831522 RepID=UPI001BA4A9B9|nr:VanW family protein [Paenibacillus sp. Marseille-Q4541]
MKKIHISFIVFAFFILLFAFVFGWLYMYAHQSKIPPGVHLSDWSVGGQNQTTVLHELDEKLTALENLPLTVQSENNNLSVPDLTLADAGVSFSADKFKQALSTLSEGGLIQRVVHRWHFSEQWEIETTMDSDQLKQKLTPEWEKEQFGTPVNAVRQITPNDEVVYVPEQSTRRIKWDQMKEKLSQVIPDDFSLLAQKDQTTPSIFIDLPLQEVKPSVTIASLKEEGIERKIIEVTTSLGSSGEGRAHNVSAAASALNGLVLKPGDIFDYGSIVEKAEKESGFQEAPVIVKGQLVPGVGGGICQVSSTLYNAALRTGLEIVERRNHSLPVSYLPKGLDATFASGFINFRFKNTTGKSLLIKADVKDRELLISFFGTFPENVSYELDTNLLETLSAPLSYVTDASLSPGSEVVRQAGSTGYVVASYQIKKVDGEVVSRKLISKDTYRPQERVLAVNRNTHQKETPSDSPDMESPPVEDGVRTENGN